jgi:hypothetical protein
MDPLTAGMSLAQLVMSGWGQINSANQNQWNDQYLTNLLNKIVATQAYAGGRMQEQMPSVLDPSRQMVQGNQEWLMDPQYGLLTSTGENIRNQIGQFSGPNNQYNNTDPNNPAGAMYFDPRINYTAGGIGALTDPSMNPMLAGMQGNIANILGGTNPYQGYMGSMLDRAGDIGQGIGPGMLARGAQGENLVNSGGQTNFNATLGDRFNDQLRYGGMTGNLQGIFDTAAQGAGYQGYMPGTGAGMDSAVGQVGTGGYTPGLDALRGEAFGVLGGGGQTPVGATGQGLALQQLLNQGRTDETDYMSQLGSDLAGREPLMSMDEARSQAMNSAATMSQQEQAALQREALSRGGAAITAGNRMKGFEGITDRALRRESDMLSQASQQQQALGLQERGMGFDALGQSRALASARENQYGGLLGQLEGTATNRYGIGSNLASSAEQIAAQRYGTGLSGISSMDNTAQNRLFSALGLQRGIESDALARELGFGNLAMQGEQSQLARMGLGNEMLTGYTGNQLGGMNAMNGLQSTGQGWENLGLTQGLNSANFQKQGLNDIYSQYMGNLQNNNARMTGNNTSLNDLYGRMLGLGGLGTDMQKAGLQQQGNLMQGWQNMFSQAGAASPGGGAEMNNPYQSSPVPKPTP